MWKKLYGLLIFILNISSLYGGLTHCCLKTSAACRRKCELLKEPNNVKKFTRRWRKLTDIVAKCPRGEINFWRCLPSTSVWKDFLAESKRRQRKPTHSICCKDAKHRSCEILCRTSRNVTKLLYNENCNKIREPKLSQCVAKIHATKQCCHGAPTTECKDACIRYFRRSHNLDGKSALERKCGTNSEQYKCVMKQSDYKDVIQEYTECCGKATTRRCKRACQQELQQLQNMSVFFAQLNKVCGRVNMQNPLYECITQTSMVPESQPMSLGILVNEPIRTRTARKELRESKGCCGQCCYRAKSINCQDWCHGMTASPSLMGLWDTMYLSCMQDPREEELSNCMHDILEPCQIGVKSEMKFCTNFNNRPLELFRRCDRHGDDEARELYKLWSSGVVSVLDYTLVFKNVRKCKPEMFKAMACLISIKPCNHVSVRRQVCRRDCEELLNACLDHSKMDKQLHVRQLCAAMLSKENQTDCISVRDYITKPDEVAVQKNEVTQPCDSKPCGKRQVCIINSKCVGENRLKGLCKPYSCSDGCRKGNLIIPLGQRAKLRVDNHRNRECYQVWKCKRSRGDRSYTFLSDWIDFNCNKKRSCSVDQRRIDHGEVIAVSCNTCRCNDGELLCTKKYCGYEVNQLPSVTMCNCDDAYNPGCGGNNMLYPNPCVTRCCNEESPYNVGTCDFMDPCKSNPCPRGRRCIPRRGVLLNTSGCPQYVCIADKTGCESHGRNQGSDFVCGYDAITYKNKCFAHASGTAVDYIGPCLSNRERIGKNSCAGVTCPDVPQGECDLFQPPGACCPICGSILRILYSHRDINSHYKYIRNEPIAVFDIVNQMRQLQRVAECSLYGHRSIEGDLVILIVVNTKRPTQRQIHACATEAERINKYINFGSPVVTTFYYLSILKISRLKKAKWKDNGISTSPKLYNFAHTNTIVFLCTLIVLYLSDCR